ncbi:MAG: hypothetical protein ACRDIE_13385, partial [Chloroflexota bacterium]
MTPSERPTSSSFTKNTGDLVRDLLARSARVTPVHLDSVANGSRDATSARGSQLIKSTMTAPSVWEPERTDDLVALPMPALTIEEMAERAKRPIPHPIPKDARDPEVYRMIYGGLKLPRHAPVVVIGITSAIRGEGRSTIACLMAQILSKELGTRVTLVDADI